MLTCTGKIGEVIVLDDNSYITVLSIKDNQVLLSFNYVDKIAIHRSEISKNIPVLCGRSDLRQGP